MLKGEINMRADLHSHTIYSDGSLTVEELVARAIEHKLDVLAITDHDNFEGSAIGWHLNTPLHMIFGVELSTEYHHESVHVLGYFKEPLTEGKMMDILDKQRVNRKARAHHILDLLEEHFHIHLNREFIDERSSITRGSIGDEIIKQGYPYTKKEIFEKMLGHGCPCYTPSTKMTTPFGVSLIHEAGGLAVLAHPCILKNSSAEELLPMGFDGIEAVYPRKNNPETILRSLAKEHHLLVTAGSDFHRCGDLGHGDVGECYIEGKDLEKFLQVLENEH